MLREKIGEEGAAVGEPDALSTHAQLLAEKRIGFLLLTVGLVLYLSGLVLKSPEGQRAAAEGREFIDLDMAMPREFSAEVQKLDMAAKAADALCKKMRLLTLASSGDLRALTA